MNCSEVQEEFSALLDGELAPETRGAFEEHLCACSDCLRKLDRYKKVSDRYGALARCTAPADFEQRVHAALHPVPVRRSVHRLPIRRAWPLLAAAAGLLFLLTTTLILPTVHAPGRVQLTKASQEPQPVGSVAEEAADIEPPISPDVRPSRGRSSAVRESDSALGSDAEADLAREQPAKAPILAAVPPRQTPEPTPPPAGPSFDATPADAKAAIAVTDAAAEASAPIEGGRERRMPAAWQQETAPAPPPAPMRARRGLEEADAEAPLRIADERMSVSVDKQEDLRPAPALAVPEDKAPLSAPKSAPVAPRQVAGRTFTYDGKTWIQAGYVEAVGKDPASLHRGSPKFQSLVERHPEIAEIAALGPVVVFQAGWTWYRLEPPQ